MNNRRIISIDVGIKNLALCLFECKKNKMNILNWNVVDISPVVVERKKSEPDKCPNCYKKRATYGYILNDELVLSCKGCLRKKSGGETIHIFLDDMLRETNEHHSMRVVDFVNIPRMTKAKIGDFFNCLSLVTNGSINIDIPKKTKKDELVKVVHDIIIKHMIIPIKHASNIFSEKIIRTRKTGFTDFVKIAKRIPIVLDDFIGIHNNQIDKQTKYTVVVENQITKVANKMKSIQLMLTQYFVMRGIDDVRFVSAKHKLNQFGGENTNKMTKKERMSKVEYNKRKNAGIEYTRSILKSELILTNIHLSKSVLSKWSPEFENHRKKDDMADAFLQGIWFIQYSLKV